MRRLDGSSLALCQIKLSLDDRDSAAAGSLSKLALVDEKRFPRFDDVEGIDDGVPRQRTRAAVERAGRAHIGAVQSNRRFVLMRGTHCD